ncbi:hypothetical protein [Meiothermus sp. QL-1]|uniref:hypothetical protein n=1 Tax=Meiothermus sp. QL-1 TaxID=2058095 RepID=UPI0011C06717|nr:hypothetical protein [Meiothermus sp. QL-1]
MDEIGSFLGKERASEGAVSALFGKFFVDMLHRGLFFLFGLNLKSSQPPRSREAAVTPNVTPLSWVKNAMAKARAFLKNAPKMPFQRPWKRFFRVNHYVLRKVLYCSRRACPAGSLKMSFFDSYRNMGIRKIQKRDFVSIHRKKPRFFWSYPQVACG